MNLMAFYVGQACLNLAGYFFANGLKWNISLQVLCNAWIKLIAPMLKTENTYETTLI